MKEHYKFTLKPLPYGYYDIEPYISEQTMKQHHVRHLGGYVSSLNSLIEENPQYSNMSLTELYNCAPKVQQIGGKMRFLSGAVYNHNLFFSILCPACNDAITAPSGALHDALKRDFGSFERFTVEFRNAAESLRGSGWVNLCKDSKSRARIVTVQNHDRPRICEYTPIILLDMWEHAYYLDYLDRKKEYVENFFRIINWRLAEMLWDSTVAYK